MIEIVPPDLLPLVQKEKGIKIQVVNQAGRQYSMRFNVLHKPFDNAKIRQAVLYALNQKDFLDANVGNPEYYKECKSLFPCGSPMETTKGWEDKLSGNAAKAKQLLTEAGYDGTPVVLMHQTDIAGHNNLATAAKPQLEKAGFKVDLQSMDWQTLVGRRAKKDPLNAGGWSAFFTSWAAADVLDPVAVAFLNASCDKATFGWPRDPELEKLRDAFAKETDPAKQKEIAARRPGARGGLSDACAAGPVHHADRRRPQGVGPAALARTRAVERREEVTRRGAVFGRIASSWPGPYGFGVLRAG